MPMPLILLVTSHTIYWIQNFLLFILSFNVCYSYWWNTMYFINIARYELILLLQIQKFFCWIYLIIFYNSKWLLIKYPCLFWMAKKIFVSYRIYILAQIISKNLNNSSHFLIQIMYVIFQKFYAFSFLYPVLVFLVAVCNAADNFILFLLNYFILF